AGTGRNARTLPSVRSASTAGRGATHSTMNAETAYLFRHAMLREAAYGLQLPSDRSRLHELAIHLIEAAFGGRAPEPAPLDAVNPPRYEWCATDVVASELSDHARQALTGVTAPGAALSVTPELHRRYVRRAAEYAEKQYQVAEAVSKWRELSDLLQGAARAEALRKAGALCFNT